MLRRILLIVVFLSTAGDSCCNGALCTARLAGYDNDMLQSPSPLSQDESHPYRVHASPLSAPFTPHICLRAVAVRAFTL